MLLVLCIFLPTLRVCGEPTTPLGFPMFWTPYVVGAIVFAATFALRPAALAGFALALRVVVGITAAGFGVPIVGAMLSGWPDPMILVGYPALAIVISAVAVPARSHEAMIARCGLVTGLGSTIWFTALAADHDAMFGAYVSLVAAVGLSIGCASWWGEAFSASRRSPRERSTRRGSA